MGSKKPPGPEAKIDAARYTAWSPERRQAEEEQAISEVVRRFPKGQRQAIRNALENPHGFSGGSLDPEVARLIGVIYSRRAANRTGTVAAARIQEEARAAQSSSRVRVRVAVVQSLSRTDALGLVIRSPDDGGVPLVVFSEGSLNDDDLAAGINAAIRSRDQDGERVPAQTVQVLRGRRGPEVRIAGAGRVTWASLSDELTPVEGLPVVGAGRIVEVMAPRLQR